MFAEDAFMSAAVTPANRRRRLLRFPQLESTFGISFSRMHIDRLERSNQFPKRVHFGANSVGWWDTEVEAWLEARSAERNIIAPPIPPEKRGRRGKAA
jgi:prophage regulatory protein